jgi:hypothetical protein
LDSHQKISFQTDLKGNISGFSVQMPTAGKPIVFTRLPEKKMMERAFLEKFVGQYEFQGMTVTILIKEGNALFASVPGQGDLELVPYKGTEFNLKNIPDASLEFILDAAGVCTGAKFKQAGAVLDVKKK